MTFAVFFVMYNICLSRLFEGAYKIQTNAAHSILEIDKICIRPNLQQKFLPTELVTRISDRIKIRKLLICSILRYLYSDIYSEKEGRSQTIIFELTGKASYLSS